MIMVIMMIDENKCDVLIGVMIMIMKMIMLGNMAIVTQNYIL